MDGPTSPGTTGHPMIMANRITSTPVFNREGEHIGHIDNLSIDKVSGRVAHAILSFGGFLGIGDKLHPLPWDRLDYQPDKAGYVVSLSKEELKAAPALTREDLETLGAGPDWRDDIAAYYGMGPAI
ncbi:PRC-barrel domain-containing protein [Caulobacter sp. LjRoot300]|uniref:PRC-barrel domain-containing protein n=1 Tax=Caulobacter sp. LjRoot300 TaxID=3342321 RepID=UPI003ECD62BA